MQDPVLGMAVEIPFVPASQRKGTQIVEDSIVVVGQARQKKRKRTKSTVDHGDPSHSADDLNAKTQQEQVNLTLKDEVPSGVEEPFDFSVVPNILDNNPDLEESTVKKRKKQKKKNGMYVNQQAQC
jgi:exosome complex exonuclease RRP6